MKQKIMKQLSTKSLVSQRGSFYTMLIILVLLGSVMTCALKIAPLYMDNSALHNSMLGITIRPEYTTMSISDIRKEMLKALQVNNIDNFNAENIVLAREGSQDFVDINYESRVLIVGNLYALVDFKNRFDR